MTDHRDRLKDLHQKVLDKYLQLVDELDDPTKAASLLKGAADFLKDNNIEALLDQLPPEEQARVRQTVLDNADELDLPFPG